MQKKFGRMNAEGPSNDLYGIAIIANTPHAKGRDSLFRPTGYLNEILLGHLVHVEPFVDVPAYLMSHCHGAP